MNGKSLQVRLRQSCAHSALSRRNKFAFPAAVLLAAFLALGPAAGLARAQSGELVRFEGHVPPQLGDGTALFVGHYEPTSMLRLALALTPPHLEEEEAYIAELRNPDSPNYRQFLSAEEWAARFAPSVEDEQKVVDWARSQGLKVVQRYPNRLLVDVEAPAGVLEKVFAVTINRYSVGDDIQFSNDRDPSLPADFTGKITAVMGLNNIQRMQSSMPGSSKLKLPDYAPGPVMVPGEESHGSVQQAQPLAEENGGTTNISNGGYIDPSDVWSSQMYNYGALMGLGHCCNVTQHNSSAGSPPDSSIALATWGTVNFADTTGFFTHYGLAWNLTAITIDGPFPTCPAGQYCYSDETTLDSEWSTATSNDRGAWQNTARVFIYMDAVFSQNGNADMYNQMLNDGHARVFSTSWSCTENYGCSSGNIAAWHSIFNEMVGRGWTLMTASGDRGSTDDCSWNKNAGAYNSAPHFDVSYPASDPDVVGVGGTAINGSIGPGNTFIWGSEPAWQGGTSWGSCGANNGGSGGGVSSIAAFTKPGYQNGLYPDNPHRLVPDISLNSGGIGQNYYYHGGMHPVGGTSIASPEMAGFFAQENAYLDAVGNICGAGHNAACSPIGDPHGDLYYEGIHHAAYHTPFYDIKNGCNSNDATTHYGLEFWCAGTGYDVVTGWGAANMLQLAWAMNWMVLNHSANGLPYVTFTGPVRSKWYNTNQTVSWTVHDFDGNVANPHPTGIAGFTQAWDSIPSDPTSEPNPGSGNLFYAGPQYPNATNGCLSFINGACAGGVSQGCHTAHVHGWNNEGWTTAGQSNFAESYGPICYDTLPPLTVATLAGKVVNRVYTGPVTVALTASDPGTSPLAPKTGSGVAHTYYSYHYGRVRSLTFAYRGPFKLTYPGAITVDFYSVDNAGNTEKLKSITFTD